MKKIIMFLFLSLFFKDALSLDLFVNFYGIKSNEKEDKISASIAIQGKGKLGFVGETILIEDKPTIKFGVFHKIVDFQVNSGIMIGKEDKKIFYSDDHNFKKNMTYSRFYLGFDYKYLSLDYVLSKGENNFSDIHFENGESFEKESINFVDSYSSIWLGIKIPF